MAASSSSNGRLDTILIRVTAGIMLCAVTAFGAHLINTGQHESPQQKEDRIRRVSREEIRVSIGDLKDEIADLRAEIRELRKELPK